MFIRVLLNLGYGLPDYKEGEEREVPEKEGRMLIANNWAVEIEPTLGEPVESAAGSQDNPAPKKKRGRPRKKKD